MLYKTALTILALAGGIAFLWLVVIRILAKLSGGEPCPYTLAWLVDNPLRRRYMGRVLERVGIRRSQIDPVVGYHRAGRDRPVIRCRICRTGTPARLTIHDGQECSSYNSCFF